MTSLNSRLQLALLNRKKGRNAFEKGFTLVELMIVIVIVGILSAIALPNFLSQTAKAKITEPLGKVSAGLKQAQSIWVEQGNFTDVTCADVGFKDAAAEGASTSDFTENGWTYVCSPVAVDGVNSQFKIEVTGVANGANANLGLTNCSIDGPTGVITACTKDTDASG